MLAGPIFSREALTSPRQFRHYLMRSGYVGLLLVLLFTITQATFGFQEQKNVGEYARFGSLVFQIFSIVQLSLVLFFALLFAGGSIAQEKDRGTLILLLLTDLRDTEIVLGKLFASLLTVAVLLLASLPVLSMVQLLGGVGMDQVLWALAICAAAALAAGSWGSLVAFWREKTFQTLAISVLGAVVFLGVVEAVIRLSGPNTVIAHWAALLNPYRSLFDVLTPLTGHTGLEAARVSALDSVVALLGLSVVLSMVAISRLRIWNPSRTLNDPVDEATSPAEADRPKREVKHRSIWSNPVIWREMRTRAYGRRIFFIKLAYLALAAFATVSVPRGGGELMWGVVPPAGIVVAGLSLLSLMLINAQAVTALTGERDGKTLELLLVTDITAQEFIFGKLGGILYNTKELILVPLVLAGLQVYHGSLTVENFVYLAVGFLVLVAFAAMLGLHSGFSFDNSRVAIANSLGTMFFLFIGILIMMVLLAQASGSFHSQFANFALFVVVGGIGLYFSLTHKNPSTAFGIAAGVLPFLTFYSVTEFLLGGSLGVCVCICFAYGFTTLAMLIPAVSDFDVALGRTTLDRG